MAIAFAAVRRQERIASKVKPLGPGAGDFAMKLLSWNVLASFGLAFGILLPSQISAAPNTASLQGAWVQQDAPCETIYITQAGQTRFRQGPGYLFTSAFIIDGNRLTTPNATCQIVSMAARGSRTELSLACTTRISTGPIKALLSLGADGSLIRFFRINDRVGYRYQRCGR